VERLRLGPCLREVAIPHLVALTDQVEEDAEERHHDDEHHPARLAPVGGVVDRGDPPDGVEDASEDQHDAREQDPTFARASCGSLVVKTLLSVARCAGDQVLDRPRRAGGQ
jgi:hypothetical protein